MTESAPIWERLPARELTPRELAAALPSNVPGVSMRAWVVPESGGEYDEVILSGRRYHYLVLGTAWYRLSSTEFGAENTPHPEAVKTFNAENNAGYPADGSAVLVAEYDGETRRYAVNSVEYETMSESEAGGLRAALAIDWEDA